MFLRSFMLVAFTACRTPPALMQGDAGAGSNRCATPCAADQVCSEGVCIDLPATCPCPVESYCDLASNSCKVGCVTDDECSHGRSCDQATRTCIDGCQTPSDCTAPANADPTCTAHGMCGFTCRAGYMLSGTSCLASVAPMPTARHDLAVAVGADGLIYAIGGSTIGGRHRERQRVHLCDRRRPIQQQRGAEQGRALRRRDRHVVVGMRLLRGCE